MPIYEYLREDGEVIEVIQSVSDDPLTECPKTGKTVEKMISRSSFHLKGQGWYKTDYGKSGSAGTETSAPKSESSDSSSDSASGSSAKSDAKASGGSCATGCGCH